MVLGWRCWYEQPGSVYQSADTAGAAERWAALPDDGVVLKMIYYQDGTRQIQQADWYFEAPHQKGIIRGTSSDEKKDEAAQRYPGAVFKRGKWMPDDWYRQLVDEAMSSAW